MSIVPKPTRPRPKPPEEDPFHLGWRYVTRTLPDGRMEVDQVPLTPEDVLHPQEDDFIVNDSFHNDTRDYLKQVFLFQVRHLPHAIVTCDLRMAWDVPGVRPLGPDLTILLKVLGGRRIWRTFDVGIEGVRPILVVEITSDSTRENDIGIKVEYYHRVGIPYYVVVDTLAANPEGITTLTGYRHTRKRYVPMPLDERGWLWLEPVAMWLGIRDDQVVCFDKDGQEIKNYVEVAQARVAAEKQARKEGKARAAAENQARKEAKARAAAEAKLKELEAELRRLRGES